jgi:hypothetical protein
VGGFDIDGDGLADFLIGRTGSGAVPALYLGAAPSVPVMGGFAHLDSSAILTFSDHDGDGRPDIVGTSGYSGSSGVWVEWAGSDGTTNPRVQQVRLTASGAVFSGAVVR